MTPQERDLYLAWLHYRARGDIPKKMEAMNQLVELNVQQEIYVGPAAELDPRCF